MEGESVSLCRSWPPTWFPGSAEGRMSGDRRDGQLQAPPPPKDQTGRYPCRLSSNAAVRICEVESSARLDVWNCAVLLPDVEIDAQMAAATAGAPREAFARTKSCSRPCIAWQALALSLAQGAFQRFEDADSRYCSVPGPSWARSARPPLRGNNLPVLRNRVSGPLASSCGTRTGIGGRARKRAHQRERQAQASCHCRCQPRKSS